MFSAELIQPLGHDRPRKLRFVALATEVAQIEMPKVRADDLLRGVGRGFVRKMPVPA